MKKSEIILGVFGKSNPTKPEKHVLHELTRVLAGGHEDPDKWNITVPDGFCPKGRSIHTLVINCLKNGL